jgi:hypothetical protein
VNKKQIEDIAARAGWTLAQAAVAFGIVEAGSMNVWWSVPIATALSTAKTFVQHKLDSGVEPAKNTSL